ncbi:MAG TPA: hypothetical protein VLT33_13745, partial [Labilithrix sp.]|nr:hypothetical protein [Labilithrix sp.]
MTDVACPSMVRPAPLLVFVRALGVALLATLIAACPPAPTPPVRPPPPVPEANAPLPAAQPDGRLPPLAIPLGYRLALDLDPRIATFGGTVVIEVEVPAVTSHVVLHGRSLTITEAHAVVEGQSRPARATTRLAQGARPPNDELVLTFDRALPAGRAALSLTFTAPFGDELSG